MCGITPIYRGRTWGAACEIFNITVIDKAGLYLHLELSDLRGLCKLTILTMKFWFDGVYPCFLFVWTPGLYVLMSSVSPFRSTLHSALELADWPVWCDGCPCSLAHSWVCTMRASNRAWAAGGRQWEGGVYFPSFLSVGSSTEDCSSYQATLFRQLPSLGLNSSSLPLPLEALWGGGGGGGNIRQQFSAGASPWLLHCPSCLPEHCPHFYKWAPH